MSKTFFVTGTDTEVGKTAVSCGLLRAAEAAGLSTAAVKPVAAGCDASGLNEDAVALMANMTLDIDYAQVNPVALQEAIAPHIAAQHEGRTLQAARLAGLCRGVMNSTADLVLIEGAGGWRVPINGRETLANVAVELGTPVILVVGMRLGCINHALLTAEAIQRDGLTLAGWVANQPGQRMDCHEENFETLKRLLPATCLGELPLLAPFDAHQASEHLDVRALLGL
ncbi:MAG: dethiobiotin synthase [Gammaproteobacteria bacterium]|jgi:dethiobiotin synthetase|nr:dethiobiotin synthase [Gammaproteobacteria bacterium]